VENSFEHGNELSGSVEHWKILLVAERLVASQEALSSKELIS
jgi:hypothetical protein